MVVTRARDPLNLTPLQSWITGMKLVSLLMSDDDEFQYACNLKTMSYVIYFIVQKIAFLRQIYFSLF